MTPSKNEASFRDPSGFVYRSGGRFFRQVNAAYQKDYQRLMESGLYQDLVSQQLLIPHDEVAGPAYDSTPAYKILAPQQIPFISYPYEWSFHQLKDAALATLRIQQLALKRGMRLKDASAYNIQFIGPRPVFIDTLSFETMVEGEPWAAYRQFCQHFVAPLALMAYTDSRLSALLKSFLDGIPLDLASRMLPARSYRSLGLISHLHLQAKSYKYFSRSGKTEKKPALTNLAQAGLLDSLQKTVQRLEPPAPKTVWSHYYESTNYAPEAFQDKKLIIARWLEQTQPRCVWDLGANTGIFSRLASDQNIQTVAFDFDSAAIDALYQEAKKNPAAPLLPLVLDVTNPSPGLGWNHRERMSLTERGPADLVMCLALIHHLALAHNLPLETIAQFLAPLTRHLIIEFVPKHDSNAQKLLKLKGDIFPDYTLESFIAGFGRSFESVEKIQIPKTERILFLMRSKTASAAS